MCASSWQKTAPQGGVSAATAREFAAVPLITGKTSTSVSKISEQRSRTRFVNSSFPYDVAAPSLARLIASAISAEQPRTLSDLRSQVMEDVSYHVTRAFGSPSRPHSVVAAAAIEASRR